MIDLDAAPERASHVCPTYGGARGRTSRKPCTGICILEKMGFGQGE